MDSLWPNLPEILKSVPQNPIPVSFLGIVVLAILGFLLFKKDKSNYRLAVFLAVFFGVISLLFLLLVSSGKLVPVSLYKIPSDSDYSYFTVYSELDSLDKCQNQAKEVLIDAGYDPAQITISGSNVRAGGYFNTKEGILTAVRCELHHDRQTIRAFTYGYDSNLIARTSNYIHESLKNKSPGKYLEDYTDITKANLFSRESQLFVEENPENCMERLRTKFRILGLADLKQGGSLLWAPVEHGTFAAGCMQFDLVLPVEEDGKKQYLFNITYFGFGTQNAKLTDLSKRFGDSLADLPTEKIKQMSQD